MTIQSSKKIHFIAIGGAAMHNLALALVEKGYSVSGSDDEIIEPSLSRLRAKGILPEKEGWFPEKINSNLEAVVLGMHARADNPELLRARELGLRIFSYPEYIFEQSKDKTRVVIGGSHGKTTITAMILFVLKKCQLNFDYMVGARIDGFETMVRLSDAPLLIVEGDEYLSSAIDKRPKFHLYKANIGVISGIAWDHINVFPTYESYVKQFRIFAEQIPANGTLVYCKEDPEVDKLVSHSESESSKVPYGIPIHVIRDGITYLQPASGREIPLKVFGEHNLMNLEAARKVCGLLGVGDEQFYAAISGFTGAARRLEWLAGNEHVAVYKDFAHSPSKLKATTEAVKKQFPDRRLIACMELHTFSSLNEEFLDQYAGSLDAADIPFVYFNPHTIEHKKLKPISQERVKAAFVNEGVQVFNDSRNMESELLRMDRRNCVFLLMSSGNFDGLILEDLARKIADKSSIPA